MQHRPDRSVIRSAARAAAGLMKWLPLTALAACTNRPLTHGMGYDGHMRMYGGTYMWIVIVLIAALIIYIIAQQAGKSRGSSPPEHETALDILKKRYARGDIDKETFERLKKDIEV